MCGFSIRSSKTSRRRRTQGVVLKPPGAAEAKALELMQDWTATTAVVDVTDVYTVLVEVETC